MHPLNRLNIPWVSLLLVLFLSACGGHPPSLSKAIENKDPVEQLLSLSSDLDAARQENLDVLSPRSFAKAERLYQEAQDMLDRETELSEILLKITAGRVELQRSAQTAQIARTVLADVIKVRELALAAGAADLGAEFTATEERFLRKTMISTPHKRTRLRCSTLSISWNCAPSKSVISAKPTGCWTRRLPTVPPDRRPFPWLKRSKNWMERMPLSPTAVISGTRFARKPPKPSSIPAG